MNNGEIRLGLLLATLALALLGCGTGSDTSAGQGGTWERCCVAHELQMCECTTGTPCDYGWGVRVCGDGSCRNANEQCPFCWSDEQFGSSKDPALEPLNGWERCCLRGETRLCLAQPTLDCAYSKGVMFHADGSCSREEDEMDGGR